MSSAGVLVPNSYEAAWQFDACGPPKSRAKIQFRTLLPEKGQGHVSGVCIQILRMFFLLKKVWRGRCTGNYARISRLALLLDHPDQVMPNVWMGSTTLQMPIVCRHCEAPILDPKKKARIDGEYLDDKEYRNHKYLLNDWRYPVL